MNAKICGITQLADALAAVEAGAWALGFNFYSQSPRYITPKAAKVIIQQLPDTIVTIGIVIDTPAREWPEMMALTGVNYLQVYEDSGIDIAFKQKVILALQAASHGELPSSATLQAYAFLLLDAPKAADGLMGGTGRLSQWDLAADLAKQYRLILAGGLNPANVHSAIQAVRPFAVDVASGVQSAPGIVDRTLLQQFLQQVNHES